MVEHNFSFLAIGSLAITSLVGCSGVAASEKSPNVIYILADDLGYGDLSCYGQTHFQTPNIDAMASRGVRFTRNYSGSTVSAPSRCALMTGKHTGHSYIRGNRDSKGTDGKGYDTPIPSEEFTLAEMFKAEGYVTACIGKWGLGGIGTEGHPNNQGFDYFFGYLGQRHAHSYYPAFLHENSQEVELNGDYSHDMMEGKALEFIGANADNPFFLYLSFTIPHAELLIGEERLSEFRGSFTEDKPFIKERGNYSTQMEPHAAFAAMVKRLDDSVGLLFSELERLGLADNTLVIFTSDNGAHAEGGADPEFFNSTGGYRGIKRALYEGGIRVPMIACYPSVIDQGVVCDETIAFWDVMPTFAELIGADISAQDALDGLSFLPLLKGEEMEQKHDYFYWEFTEQGGRQAVMRGDWKLIKQQSRDASKSYYELFDLSSDPTESINLVEEYPALVLELKELMEQAHTPSKYWKI